MRNRFLASLVALAFAISPAYSLEGGETQLAKVHKHIHNISTSELQSWLKENPEGLLIDVRTSHEINTLGGTIKTHQNRMIPRGWLEFRMTQHAPDENTPIVVYCGQNLRSPLAAKTLMDMGYKNVHNYEDGVLKWKEANLPLQIADQEPDSFLYRKPQKVVDGVWSAIGQTAPPLYENSGHNNNLTFIETSEGAIVVNASANYLLAQSFHEEMKQLSSQPVKYVILENGQTHAAMGAQYWKEQGAEIIAHVDAADEIKQNAHRLSEQTFKRYRDKAMGSKVVHPDTTFEDKMVLELGGQKIELLHFGPAHSPGDISVWLPAKSLVIAGDMAFHQRLLAVFEETDTAGWIRSWESFAALDAKHVIPGHGEPTTMAEITKYTHDYLVYLRSEVKKLLEDGAGLAEAYDIDQSAYRHLDTFNQLARKNAGRVFVQMEFE
ncbi:SoxH-like protein [Candidatus Terasakiella magnetica]|uniref:SoxH-like protein n=1 Tax=Candidatus Terasakiella magnetica TaxID=1867952 RepID=A0A1C3RE15_9PROT|nr:rhodanese-like domain-containing protein [Candidatus Terasakiella magnetica]SCA55537.1 SoxH-like protein [Candidatus Terasakiella magnetica]